MAKFTYQGEDAEGKAVTNTVEADDRFKVYAIARNQGHTVSMIEESSGL